MNEPSMLGRDIWVKYVAQTGQSHVAYHRVWDVGRFMAARQAEVPKLYKSVEQVLKPELKK